MLLICHKLWGRKKTMKKINYILVIIVILVLTGCRANINQGEPIIRIGLTIDDANPASGIASQQFIKDLERFLGIQVIAVEDITYLVAIEAMRAGNLDIMMASAFNYIMAREVVDVELLATISIDNNRNYTAFITSYDKTDIQTVADLKGRSFAFVDAASTSGGIFPKYYLVQNFGVDPELIMHNEEFFSTAVYSGSHNSSIMGVYFGDFDGAAVAAMQIDNLIDSGAITEGSIRVIGRTEYFPNPAYIVRSELGSYIIRKLSEFFLTYNNEDYFYYIWGSSDLRFEQPNPEEFDKIVSLVSRLGIGR